MKDLIIAKQELIDEIEAQIRLSESSQSAPEPNFPNDYVKSQITEPVEYFSVFDQAYLDECIKKATPGLSKIKDVDACLNEIRGTEQPKTIEVKSAEEILTIQYEMAVYDNNGHLTKGDILRAMHEYASQFKTERREELMKFMVWHKNYVPIGTMKQASTLVDEYLQNENKDSEKK